MFDVLVIGAGLAGATAALTARAAGAKVAVASRSWGATALSTGALDVAFIPALSPTHQTARTLAEHVMDLIAHRQRHPYGVMGLERTFAGLRAGYATLRAVLGGTELELPPLDLEATNRGLPSSLGAVVPAAAAYGPHWGVDLSLPLRGRWGVLQLRGDPEFDARRVCAGLRHDAEGASGVAPDLVEVQTKVAARPPMAMAAALDDEELLGELCADLAGKTQGLAGLITPPVLGLGRAAQVRGRLSEAVGAPVLEALAHVPSVPGVRLQRRLERALAAAGVEPVGEIQAPLWRDRTVLGARTQDDLEIRAGAVVLASGRFIAGGVRWDDDCKESLFGLPVVSELGPLEDDTPHGVVREHPVEAHPLLTAGVGINEALQPLREGRVAFTNLFCAGMVIGGFASRFALTADGVALATGHWAGSGAVA